MAAKNATISKTVRIMPFFPEAITHAKKIAAKITSIAMFTVCTSKFKLKQYLSYWYCNTTENGIQLIIAFGLHFPSVFRTALFLLLFLWFYSTELCSLSRRKYICRR